MSAQVELKAVTFAESEYYNVKDLRKYDPAYFCDAYRSNRQIISIKNIPSDVIYYACLTKYGW